MTEADEHEVRKAFEEWEEQRQPWEWTNSGEAEFEAGWHVRDAEIERLREHNAALHEALEGMVGTYAPKAKKYGAGSPAVAVALAALTLVEQRGMG